ncbi:hypothetical protein K7X08_015246 [Anisodus acutangulus]|uniref:F-box associated beta-propeller type 1 domain-containing protein n=1 Tax=Anisodus acutangulus TaxID=402998 RepID=A0A9Q1L3S5_9SOLA|nr:hypothetical protein K7X08_015246 [Anisodus acutangulus]
MVYARGNGEYLVPPKVEVYALGSGIWKEFDGFIPDFGVIEYSWTQAIVCGKVHWAAYKRNRERKVENLIMVFDLNEEIFQELSLPEILVNELPTNLNAAECRESLAVYQYDTRDWSSRCSIWVMKRYGDTESWRKEYNVVLGYRHMGMVLGFRNDSSILFTDTTGTLTAYNPETHNRERHGILGSRYSFYFDSYRESLGLLDKGELLSPFDVAYEETTDDENDAEKMAPRRRERWMHYDMHQYLTAFLGDRNI